MSSIAIEPAGHGCVLATWNDHVLAYWYAAPPLQGILSVPRLIQAHAKKQRSQRCGYLCVFESTVVLPDGPARKAINEEAKAMIPLLRGAAVVIPGTGFVASAQRAFVTGVFAFMGGQLPVKCFNSVAEADRWLGELVTSAGDVWGADVADAVAAMKAAKGDHG